jgi:hypothetical protein
VPKVLLPSTDSRWKLAVSAMRATYSIKVNAIFLTNRSTAQNLDLMDIVLPWRIAVDTMQYSLKALQRWPIHYYCEGALYIIRALQLTILALKVWHQGPCLQNPCQHLKKLEQLGCFLAFNVLASNSF